MPDLNYYVMMLQFSSQIKNQRGLIEYQVFYKSTLSEKFHRNILQLPLKEIEIFQDTFKTYVKFLIIKL